jgi:adenosine deaminase
MAAAEQDFGITSGLILSFLRHLSEEDAFTTWREAQPWRDRFIGVGLDSSELGHPPSKFARVFDAVRASGLKVLAHAGEEGPADYVREALDVLKVDRVDHGNRALDDPALVERLAQSRMTLTVCPLSNVRLCVVRELREHPIRRMLQLGLRVTVNSDDPAYFGGYLLANYVEPARALGLTRAELAALARNSFLGSFLPTADVARRIGETDGLAATAGADGG